MMINEDAKLRIINGAQKSARISQERKQERAGLFDKKCLVCNNQIPYEKRKNNFCSRSCAAKHNNLLSPKRKPEGKCLLCNIAISASRTYCSECYLNIKGLNNRDVKIDSNLCIVCHKVLPNQRVAYCSGACRRKFEDNKVKKEIELGLNSSAGTLRRWMLRNTPRQCAICEISEWTGAEVPLIMDHIDGDSSNNKLENLRMICPNCDALLPTYKSRNRGNGRAYRRQRYAEGKSY